MRSQKRVRIQHFDLSDIYDARQLQDVVLIARERVLTAFDHAAEIRNGRMYGTNYYLGGAGVRPSELAQFIAQKNMKGFVTFSTLPALPARHSDLSPRAKIKLVQQIQEYSLQLAVNDLIERKVVWHDGCVWNILPRALDTYREGSDIDEPAVKEGSLAFS